MMESLQLEALLANTPDLMVTFPWFGQINLTPYLFALVVFVVLNLIFWLVRAIILVRLKALSTRTHTDIDDMLVSTVAGIRSWVYSVVSIFVALQLFDMPSWADQLLLGVFLFAVVWQLVEVAVVIIDYGANRMLYQDEDQDGEVDPNAATATHMVGLLGRIVLWGFGGIFLLSNLGVEVTSLIAGLGIGGIAVAFALQGILSDLFSSFSIYFDKPFRIGDFIVIGEHSGNVERIGIKTTRIRTLQGEELVVSNAELTSTRVQNFKRMQERRIVFIFGITYETAPDKVEAVNGLIEKIFNKVGSARLDRVHFTTFADSALVFEVVYYVNSAEYSDYLDANQKINQGMLRTFAEEGIEFAYPTQTIYARSV